MKTDSSLYLSFFGRVVISSNRLAEQGILLLDADLCSLSVVQQQRLGKCASIRTGCTLTQLRMALLNSAGHPRTSMDKPLDFLADRQ
jgi:hypothetical protein